MAAIKPAIQKICTGIAGEFPGWTFAAEEFRNNTLGHTGLFIRPFSQFKGDFCHVEPSAAVNNKRAVKLVREIFKTKSSKSYGISMISLPRLGDGYRFYIYRQKMKFIPTPKGPIDWPANWLDLTEAPACLRKVVHDGIGYLNQYYDFSSEENLLRHLPTSEKVWAQGGLEKGAGFWQCIAHVLIGDFDFVERYRSDDVKTIYPKWIEDIDTIIAALPELKRRYAETGKVI